MLHHYTLVGPHRIAVSLLLVRHLLDVVVGTMKNLLILN